MRCSKFFTSTFFSFTACASVGAFALSARADAPSPRDVLGHLAGCFEVTYRFVEDGAHDLTITGSKEWIEPRAATLQGAAFAYQHYGLYEGQKFKHWSEEWVPSAESPNAWTQTVFSPGGRARYECKGTFDFLQIRCHVDNAPKPQRDIERTDYDTLDRDLTLQITPKGWVQNEINLKHMANGTPVATEVGWIEYVRVADSECTATPR
jgi:hypothetical protein